jgi:hypothetical protein
VEPLTFADAVPVVVLAIGLMMTVGIYGDRFVSRALFTGVLLRIVTLAFRALDYGPFRRGIDAQTFADGSNRLVDSGVGIYRTGGAGRYEWYLYALRRYGDLSVFGLEVLAVAAWLGGGLLLLGAIKLLCPTNAPRGPMWLVAVSPSGLIWTDGILREGYEFAIIALAVWAYAQTRHRAPRSLLGRGPVLAAAAATLLGGLIHTALILAAIGLIVGSEIVRGLQRETRRRAHLVMYAALSIGFLFFGQALAGPTATLQEERTQRSEYGGSASYRAGLPNLGPLTVPADVTVGYVLYVVSPLPFQVRGPFDLIALGEAWARTAIMVVALRRRRTQDTNLMLLLAVMVQLAFSVGTLNWGTALRHNYVSLAPLVVLACTASFARQSDQAPTARFANAAAG